MNNPRNCPCGCPPTFVRKERYFRPTLYRFECPSRGCLHTDWVHSAQAAENLWNYEARPKDKSVKVDLGQPGRSAHQGQLDDLKRLDLEAQLRDSQERARVLRVGVRQQIEENATLVRALKSVEQSRDEARALLETTCAERDKFKTLWTEMGAVGARQWPASELLEENRKLSEELGKSRQIAETRRRDGISLSNELAGVRRELELVNDNFRALTLERDDYRSKARELERQLDAVKIERDAAEKREDVAEDLIKALRADLDAAQARVNELEDYRGTRGPRKGWEKGTLYQPFTYPFDARFTRESVAAALDRFFAVYPSWFTGFSGFESGVRCWIRALLLDFLNFLPKLDTPNSDHPSVLADSQDRLPTSGRSPASGTVENAQVSTAAEDSMQSPVPGQPPGQSGQG